MAGKIRFPGPLPKLSGRGIDQWRLELEDWLRKLLAFVAYTATHAFKNLAPELVATITDAGDEDDGWAAANHSHRLGLVSAKGDLISHNGTDPTAFGVGAVGEVPVADPTQPVGISWQPQAGAGASLLDGCVSAWGMGEATGLARLDSIGLYRFNDLTPINGPTQVGGWIGNGVRFTRASNQYLAIADAAQQGLDIGTSDFSVSFWIKPTTWPAANWHIIGKGRAYSTAETGWEIIGQDTLGRIFIYFQAPPSGVRQTFRTHVIPPLSVWSHVVVTFDRSDLMHIFFNGVEETTIEVPSLGPAMSLNGDSTGDASNTYDFTIGADSSAAIPADIELDALHFFNRVLTAAEVSALWNGGDGRELGPLWGIRYNDAQNLILIDRMIRERQAPPRQWGDVQRQLEQNLFGG